jgi:hypothetical protein
MTHRKYARMFSGTSRFTSATTKALETSLGRALIGYKGTKLPLRRAVYTAARELCAQGLDSAQTESMLGGMVEDAARCCGADRPSLLSREPVWMSIRTDVLAAAAFANAEDLRLPSADQRPCTTSGR